MGALQTQIKLLLDVPSTQFKTTTGNDEDLEGKPLVSK